jgi:hypothetical protein
MKEETWLSVALGALGGGIITVVAWQAVSAALDSKFNDAATQLLTRAEAQLRNDITTQLNAQIPTQVRTAMDQQFQQVGLNQQSGHQLAALLNLAEATHLIGISR